MMSLWRGSDQKRREGVKVGSAGLARAELEEGLRADDRPLLGEGMEGLDEEAARARLEVDVADRRGGEAGGGGEPVEQAALGGVERQLVVEVGEHLGIDALGLEARLVLHHAAAGSQLGR